MTPQQIAQLQRYAVPPQSWPDWVPGQLVTRFAEEKDGGIAIGHHPEAGWFVLHKPADKTVNKRVVKQPKDVYYVQNPKAEIPDEPVDTELGIIVFGTHYVLPPPPKDLKIA